MTYPNDSKKYFKNYIYYINLFEHFELNEGIAYHGSRYDFEQFHYAHYIVFNDEDIKILKKTKPRLS